MTTVSFAKIVQLNIQQQYFSNSENKENANLEMMPVLSDAPGKLKFQNYTGQFSVYKELLQSEVSETNQHIETQEYIFNFPIKILDQSFFNYTDLNFEANKIWYVSGENGVVINAVNGDWLDAKPKQFLYNLEPQELENLTEIKIEKANDEIIKIPLPERPFGGGIMINLYGESDGRYQLIMNFKNQDSDLKYTFFSSDNLIQSSANIIIGWKGPIENESTPLTLFFSARPIYIKYFFMGIQSNEDWDTAKISAFEFAGQRINFRKASASETLQNGQKAYVAISEDPVPFLQRPDWEIQYSSNQLPQGFRLPYPNPDNVLRMEHSNGTVRYHSNIYVYI